MMKRLLFLGAALLGMGLSGMAQTFVADNGDGVAIRYRVTSTDDLTVAVDTNSYTGRVVVPETVSYEGTSYTVTEVGEAFRNTTVTMVSLPATVTSLVAKSFVKCYSLDSLVLNSPTPVAAPQTGGFYYPERIFTTATTTARVTGLRTLVVVPTGSLNAYKESTYRWHRIPTITTPTAVPIVVLVEEGGPYRVDSVVVDRTVRHSNGYYEIGDTAILRIEYNSSAGWGYFMGWSNGLQEPGGEFVVEHADTIVCYASKIHSQILDVNNISTPVSQFGALGTTDNTPAYMIGNTGASTIFANALWIGSGEHVAANRFFAEGSDFYPGPLGQDATTTAETAMRYNRVWKVSREMIDYHIAHVGEAGYTVPDDILTWPGNRPDGTAGQMAPYYDADSSGRYNPYAGDYPLIRGDEAVFAIFNDSLARHRETGGQALGVEVHAMAYAFHEPQDTALWNTVFVHYDIINCSQNNYENTYLAVFNDFDIGYASDDYVGCDVQRNMYYGFNGNQYDQDFPNVPPAQGCVFLGGASVNGDRLGMSSFLCYENSTGSINGEPLQASDYYCYMHSYWKNGQHLKYGGNGVSTGTTDLDCEYMFPGASDPQHIGTGGVVPEINPNDWTEVTAGNQPYDRRGVGASGPFTFESHSVQQLDVAYVTAFGPTDNYSSIPALCRYTDNVRRQYLRDTTDSGRPFTYMPYSAPHEVGIEEAREGAALQVYPNPTTGLLTVDLPMRQTVELFDMTGRRLATLTGEGRQTLDLSAYPAGIYMLRSAGQVTRIVKQ